MEWESQVDSGTSSSIYNWLWGMTDGVAGESDWIYQDLLNNTIRLGLQEQDAAGNNSSSLSGTGTGNVCFQCAANSGTGGVAFSSGGASPATVATVDSSGNAQFNGTLIVSGTSQSAGTMSVRNSANAEVDYYLWAGSTAAQKESFTYKNYAGTSEWYLVNNTTNDWAINEAASSIDSFKAYNSANSGDTYVNAQQSSGVVRVNYETGSGTGMKIYGGGSGTLYAAFTGTAAIQFPGLAASSGYNCLQVDSSGYMTNTGSACGTGTGSGSVTSVALSLPSWLAVSGSPITGAGTFTVTGASETANYFLAAPNGSSGPMTPRAIVAADMPTLNQNTTGSAGSFTGSLSGDVTGTQSATSVVKVNGESVPASKAVVGTTHPTRSLPPPMRWAVSTAGIICRAPSTSNRTSPSPARRALTPPCSPPPPRASTA